MNNIRTYNLSDVISFTRVNETYGHFSNMAKCKILISNITINSSEALYQSLKYPFNPEIQSQIIIEKSPLSAKRISYKYLQYVRKDWENVKINIMRLALRLKLLYNTSFKNLLISTNHKPIAEISYKDIFWGTKLVNNKLIGENILGRLLMELREEINNTEYFNSTNHLLMKISDLKICNICVSNSVIDKITNHKYCEIQSKVNQRSTEY